MHTSLKLMSLAALSLALGACNANKGLTVNNSQQSTVTVPEKMTVAKAKQELKGEWIVTNVDGTPVESANQLSLSFFNSEENASNDDLIDFCGNTGCNILNGAFRLSDKATITPAGEFLSTLKACPDAPFELTFSQALAKAAHFSVKVINNESILYLTDASGDLVMTLRKHNINYINGAWAVTQIGGQEVPENVGIKIVIDLPEEKLHGNAGCNILNGTVTMDMNRENGISFSKLFTTRMTCPNIAYEQLFIQTLEQVTQCSEGPTANEALLLDSAGKPIIAMKRISLK